MAKIAHWRFDIAPDANGKVYDMMNGASGLVATWNTTPPAITKEGGKRGVRVNGTQWCNLVGSCPFVSANGVTIAATFQSDTDATTKLRHIIAMGLGGATATTDSAIYLAIPSDSEKTAGNYQVYLSWKNNGTNWAVKHSNSLIRAQLTKVVATLKTGARGIYEESIASSTSNGDSTPSNLTVVTGKLLGSVWDVDEPFRGFITEIEVHSNYMTPAEVAARTKTISQSISLNYATQDDVASRVASGQGSLPSMSYDAANGRVKASGSALHSGVYFPSILTAPSPDNFVFEADLSLVSDYTARENLGVWLTNGTPGNGYRLSHLDNSWGISAWSGYTEATLTNTMVNNVDWNVGQRKVLRIEKQAQNMYVILDDVLIFTASDSAYSGLRPEIFLYGCEVGIHSVSFVSYGAGATAVAAKFSDLNTLILSKAPLYYFDLTEQRDGNLTNKGSGLITAKWKGQLIPQIASTEYCDLARLDGSTWVELAGTQSVDFSAGFTVEAFLSLDSWRIYNSVFECGLADRTKIVSLTFTYAANQILSRYYNGTANSSTILSVDLSYGNLIHLMGVVNPTTGLQYLYLNGVLVGSAANTFTVSPITMALGNLFYSLWGQTGQNTTDLITLGWAKYVAVYNRALTGDDAVAHSAKIPTLTKAVLPLVVSDVLRLKASNLVFANKEPWELAHGPENSKVVMDLHDPQFAFYAKDSPANNLRPPVRSEMGYIQGVITRKGIPAAGQRVVCMDHRFNVVAEILSAGNGAYRFDSLPINRQYIILAKDNEQYKYNPAAIDMKTPEAYP